MKSRPQTRRKITCPPTGALMRYRDRIVRVTGEASGQRAMIESVDKDGQPFRSTVKWVNLTALDGQLF